jgi:hypothetical protein
MQTRFAEDGASFWGAPFVVGYLLLLNAETANRAIIGGH